MTPQRAPLEAIERVIRTATGNRFTARDCEARSGGCTHAAASVGDGHTRFFVKFGPTEQLGMFEAEADGLAAIAASGSFRTPAVVGVGTSDTHAFLILEHIALRPIRENTDARAFADALAQLHRSAHEHFGWRRDNYLGASPQRNAQTDNWSRFLIEQRFRPQFEHARSLGHGGELQRLGGILLERIPALFLEYRPLPSLLHGDLWHGNAGIDDQGRATVFDPAVHAGDRESDLAMAELFGGFPSAFHARYRSAWPPHTGYETRKPLYMLYHVLNHLNLFGRGYLREAERLLVRLTQ